MQKCVNQIKKYEIITFNKTIFKKVGQVDTPLLYIRCHVEHYYIL